MAVVAALAASPSAQEEMAAAGAVPALVSLLAEPLPRTQVGVQGRPRAEQGEGGGPGGGGRSSHAVAHRAAGQAPAPPRASRLRPAQHPSRPTPIPPHPGPPPPQLKESAVSALFALCRGSQPRTAALMAHPAAQPRLSEALAAYGPCWFPCKSDLHCLLNLLSKAQVRPGVGRGVGPGAERRGAGWGGVTRKFALQPAGGHSAPRQARARRSLPALESRSRPAPPRPLLCFAAAGGRRGRGRRGGDGGAAGRGVRPPSPRPPGAAKGAAQPPRRPWPSPARPRPAPPVRPPPPSPAARPPCPARAPRPPPPQAGAGPHASPPVHCTACTNPGARPRARAARATPRRPPPAVPAARRGARGGLFV
jgi:hypothetical protein